MNSDDGHYHYYEIFAHKNLLFCFEGAFFCTTHRKPNEAKNAQNTLSIDAHTATAKQRRTRSDTPNTGVVTHTHRGHRGFLKKSSHRGLPKHPRTNRLPKEKMRKQRIKKVTTQNRTRLIKPIRRLLQSYNPVTCKD